MADTPSAFLTPWANFYVMTGSSSATLTGLLFVAITLMTRVERTEDARAAVSAFTTPIVVHFAAVLIVSAVFIAPWPSLVHVAVVIALIGLSGIVYILRVMHRTRGLTMYTADLEDWTWYNIVPLAAYGGLAVGATILAGAPVRALFIIAGGAVLLIVTAVRNAWDIVTYLMIERP